MIPKQTSKSSSIQRVLLIKLRHHGDVLLTTPVLNALKEQLPSVKIDILIYAETKDMIQFHPNLNKIHCVDRQWKKEGNWHLLKQERKLLHDLKACHYDLILNLSDNWRGAILCRLLKPKISSAECYIQRPQSFWKNSFTHPSPRVPINSLHIIEHNLKILCSAGLDGPTEINYDMGISETILERITMLYQDINISEKHIIHIHPGARWGFKRWDNQKWVTVIQYLLKHHDIHIVLTGAPNTDEKNDIKEILEQVDNTKVTNFVGRFNLQELGAAIKQSQLFLGVDSAPMHMAAALKVPCLAIFGPSNINEWKPWSEHSEIFYDENNVEPLSVDTSSNKRLTESISAARFIESLQRYL